MHLVCVRWFESELIQKILEIFFPSPKSSHCWATNILVFDGSSRIGSFSRKRRIVCENTLLAWQWVEFNSVFLNLFRFGSPLLSIAEFAFTSCEWMADVTIIIVHRMFVVSLDSSICTILSTAFYPPCRKLARIPSMVWLQIQLPKMFFAFKQHFRCLKTGKKKLFTSRVICDWWMERMLLFVQIFVLPPEKFRRFVLMNTVVGVRRNFYKGERSTFCLSFSSCWWCDANSILTKRFIVSTPERKKNMLRQQPQNVRFAAAAVLLFHSCFLSHCIKLRCLPLSALTVLLH